MTEPIIEFKGEYRWLSNFWVEADGLSVEHYYQAAKASTQEEQDWVLSSKSPGEAKRRGRKVKIRPDWEDTKREMMSAYVWAKFTRDPVLREKLLDTGDAPLVEGNTWGDTYWGVDLGTGEGYNYLGQTLMAVRELIRLRLAQDATEETALDQAVVRTNAE